MRTCAPGGLAEVLAVTSARDFADLLSPLLAVSPAALRDGLALFGSVASLGAFDAVLAAATVESGASAIVSADGAFGGVAGLTQVRPDREGVELLLGR